MFTHPIAIIQKFENVVVDYAYDGFFIFAIEYLRENEKVRETVFACSYGAQVESFKQIKKLSKIS